MKLPRRKLAIRFSWSGIIVAGLYLLLFVLALAWIFLIASKNPADSGESGIILLLFVWPWVSFIPIGWLNLGTAVLIIVFNALILYSIFGGLRLTPSQQCKPDE